MQRRTRSLDDRMLLAEVGTNERLVRRMHVFSTPNRERYLCLIKEFNYALKLNN